MATFEDECVPPAAPRPVDLPPGLLRARPAPPRLTTRRARRSSSSAAAAFEAEEEPRESTGRKRLPFTRRKGKANGFDGREQRESDVFHNPVADNDDPASPQSPGSRAVALEVERISSMNPEQQAAALAALDGEKRAGRDRCKYMVMTVGICVLLPFFVAMALLSLWYARGTFRLLSPPTLALALMA